MIRGRLRRLRGAEGHEEDQYIEIEPGELSRLFAAPGWLRDAGITSWLLVGVVVLLAGVVWLLTLTSVIFIPLVVAGVIAAVAGQLVAFLNRRGVPRALGAFLVLLLIVAAGALAAYLVLTGIGSETSSIRHQLTAGADKIEGWLKDLGVGDSSAQQANHDVSSGTSDSFHALVDGLATGIEKLASLAFFVAMTVLSLFFLLKDGPSIRSWAERHLGLPTDVAHTISGRTLQSLRGYFLGVTIVALFAPSWWAGAPWRSVCPSPARSRWSPSSAATSPTWEPGPRARSRCSSPSAGLARTRRRAWS